MGYVTLGSKAVGSIVKLKENGVLTEYIIVNQGKPSSIYDASCDGTWLLRKEIFENRQWHGSNVNDYASSTIRSYLDSTFLNRFDANIKAAIKQVKIPYRPGSGTSAGVSSGASGLSCKVFLLSGYEIGWTNADNPYFPPDGAKLTYFEAGTGTSANNKRIAYLGGRADRWWLRSPRTNGSTHAWFVYSNGSYDYSFCSSTYTIRPALVLPSSFLVFQEEPPTTPNITIPVSVRGGTPLAISWTASTDPDGNLAGYQLERSVNGGAWSQIAQQAGTTYTDNITYGWLTVQYRVRAYDSAGATSGYATSPVRTVINNSAPTAPPSITVPDTVRGGKTCALSWAAATDVDGNLAGYRLERSVAGGAWAQIYEGANRTHTDQITRGWTTVAYRVRAYDAEGATSGYTTSPTRTIINNLPPVISGADTDLGTLGTDPFSATYSATDDDGDPITITEKLDNTVLRTFTATAGTQYTVTMTADQWIQVLGGAHTLTVTAADDHSGQSVRTWTFTKSVTALTISRKVPLPADAAIERCTLTIISTIPAGATFFVEVCNNGNDAEPTWEDCTAAVLAGRKFFLTNTTKTAANWGFNYCISVNRMDATGPCHIAVEVRGAFD